MNFSSQYCRARINCVNNSDLTVEGSLIEQPIDNLLYYIAAAPADYKASFTGSGLPFQNQIQAFDNTPNRGEIALDGSREFKIRLLFPNSYCVGLGSVTIPPTLYLMYIAQDGNSKTIAIKLSDGIPFRFLTYPMKRSGPEFYGTQFNLYPMDQWKQLVASRYPKQNKMPDDFWGLKPPL